MWGTAVPCPGQKLAIKNPHACKKRNDGAPVFLSFRKTPRPTSHALRNPADNTGLSNQPASAQRWLQGHCRGRAPLQNFLNLLIDGDVGVLEAVDEVGRSGKAAEMKITADVVILVKLGEDRFDLSAIQAEIGDGHGTSVAARNGQIFVHDLAQGHIAL